MKPAPGRRPSGIGLSVPAPVLCPHPSSQLCFPWGPLPFGLPADLSVPSCPFLAFTRKRPCTGTFHFKDSISLNQKRNNKIFKKLEIPLQVPRSLVAGSIL